MHFWLGYLLAVKNTLPFPPLAISDTIKIISDLGNKIPDKSWMLYLLELFNKQRVPVELNLICSFNDDGKFHAIFEGRNRYEFKIKPMIGHSYQRQIIMDPSRQRIEYRLLDEVTSQIDTFFFDTRGSMFDFSFLDHFTGLEWHNRIGNEPYQIRYEVEISNLSYGKPDELIDSHSVKYLPYNQLFPNDDGNVTGKYPVSFNNFQTRNGYITYRINSGK